MAGSKRNEIRNAIQQRVKRFSPFELLGLDGSQADSSAVESDQKIHEQSVPLEETAVLNDPGESVPTDGLRSVPTDGLRSVPTDGLRYPQTPPSEVPLADGLFQQTPASGVPTDRLLELPSDSANEEIIESKKEDLNSPSKPPLSSPISLAPMQWRVWKALLKSEDKVISYRSIASQTKGSISGIREAIQILERGGGILSRQTIREKNSEGAIVQGFRVVLNKDVSFNPISFREAHGLLKRKIEPQVPTDRLLELKSDPRSVPTDGLRMYVCNRIHTYMAELLHLCAAEWQIREQTLVTIAETFPDMSVLEFRRSIRYLVEQAKTAKQPIQNPNAWLKAAFERNGGPLVTERMIEAQLDQRGTVPNRERTVHSPENEEATNDLTILRRYIAASVEDKVTIDHVAEERVGRLLETISADKHAGIREQARIECAREFFAAQEKH